MIFAFGASVFAQNADETKDKKKEKKNHHY